MKKALTAAAAILAAVGASTVLARAFAGPAAWIDFFLIIVVYNAITHSRSHALWVGGAAGLAEDVLTSQLLGFHAFVKTAVAYLVGGMGTKLILNQPFPQFLSLLLATLLDAGLGALLSFTVGLPVPFEPEDIGRRALANSVVGLIIFRLLPRSPGGTTARG